VLNYLEDDARCKTCVGTVRFYDDPLLQEQTDSMHPSTSAVFSWNVAGKRGRLVLPDVSYLCPHCQHTTLRFATVLF
jgi:hypothetical protein